MLRIVSEVKPYAVLFENVPGFTTLNDGNEHKYLQRTLAEMGFDAEWGHLFAKDVGAGHTRERWFCVAYASSRGCIGRRERVGGNESVTQSEAQLRAAPTKEIERCNQSPMADTTSTGLEGRNGSEPTFGKSTGYIETAMGNTERGGRDWITWGWSGAQLADGYSWNGTVKPRLGGATHGLPGWLDFVGFPARPGEPQYAYEPPRTTVGAKQRAARIKALGNAVVPQVAYPIFAAIAEWLQENDA